MKHLLLVALVGALGCKGDQAKKANETDTTDKTEPAEGPVKDAEPPGVTMDAPAVGEAFCAEPCRKLVSMAYGVVEAKVEQECGRALAGEDCETYDYLRNCIYAAKGYSFRKPKWKERFGGKGWYQADPAFEEKMIPSVGLMNIRQLKHRAAECRSKAGGKLEGKVVARLTADLDADGTEEKVEVTRTQISLGGAVVAHQLKADEGVPLEAKVVDVDKKDGRKEVLLSVNEYEDLTYYRVVGFDGKKPRVSPEIYTGELGLAGDGTVTTKDVHCGQKLSVVYTMRGGMLVKGKEKKTGKFDEAMCAACPYVYLETEAGWVFRGEILREVRSEAAATTRSMGLGRARGSVVRVKIAERKRETTYLDAVELIAGGRRIAPRRCRGTGGGGPLCTVDGVRQALESGDEVVLEFAVPPGAELTLAATGYYLPL